MMHTTPELTPEERLALIHSRISTALIGTQRRVQDITLIAVSKGHSSAAIRQFHRLGLRNFGESYAQEFARKRAELSDLTDIQWHFIGHLQSNKLKLIHNSNALIHSLDRLSLLKEIAKVAHPSSPIRTLVQLQIDPTDLNKSGCSHLEAETLCSDLVKIPGLEWEGFMGVGPASTPPDELTQLYEEFHRFGNFLWEKYSLRDPSRNTRTPRISLGMSDDLEIALRCGSSIVRIGTALFGARPGNT